jgi:hypothetical protein
MSLNMNDTISNNINNLMKGTNTNTNAPSGDLNQQDMINKALISAGLPENKLNELILQMRDQLMCDPACQKQRKGEAYKKKWELAKKNYKQAPEEVKQAEKNYYVYDKGYGAYKDMLYDRYAKSAEEFKKTSLIKHQDVELELKELLGSYTSGTTYLKRMNELLQIKMDERDHLQGEIDKYIGTTETDNRKVVYEDRARDWLTTIRQIILYSFFFCLFIYIVLGNFIPDQAYKKWKVWVVIALFFIFPYFLLNKLVQLIFSLYGYVKSWRLRKNVYERP